MMWALRSWPVQSLRVILMGSLDSGAALAVPTAMETTPARAMRDRVRSMRNPFGSLSAAYSEAVH